MGAVRGAVDDELEVGASPSWSELRMRFETMHQGTFGFRRDGEGLEVINLRAVANGSAPISWDDLPQLADGLEPEQENGVWQRQTLPRGFEVEGPAVVVEKNSAVLLEAGDTLTVLDDGTLELKVSSVE